MPPSYSELMCVFSLLFWSISIRNQYLHKNHQTEKDFIYFKTECFENRPLELTRIFETSVFALLKGLRHSFFKAISSPHSLIIDLFSFPFVISLYQNLTEMSF